MGAIALRSKCDVFILKLNIIILKLLGLAPVSINIIEPSSNNSGRSLSCNYSGSAAIYSICLIILVCGLGYMSLPEVYRTEYPNKTDLTQTIDVALALIGNIVAVVVVFIFRCRQSSIVYILNQFIRIDANFAKLFDCHQYKRRKCRSILIFWVNIFYCLYTIITHIMGFLNGYISLFTLVFPTIVCGSVITQYTLVTALVKEKFGQLNLSLLKLLRTSSQFQPYSCVNQSVIMKLFAVRETRSSLCHLTTKISRFFSLPLLFTITYFSGALIYSAYFLIRPFIVLMSPDQSLSMVINTLAFIFIIVFPIISLCILVTQISLEMDKTADVVRKLLIQFRDNKIIKSELEEFFLELLHTNVQFTACDIFPLDCSLLHSIFGMVATYLVILAQFPDQPYNAPCGLPQECVRIQENIQ